MGHKRKTGDVFPSDIEEIRRRAGAAIGKINIDLATAQTVQLDISGNMFYIFSAPNESDYVNIKVNETREPAVAWSVHSGAITPFHRLIIETPAGQTGTMVLLYGTEAPDILDIIDNRSTTVAGVGGMLDELRGDLVAENYTGVTITAAPGATLIMAARAARKGLSICALSTNSGSIFLGFDNTVTVGGAPGTWFHELAPGATWPMDDYRGAIYGIATAQQIVGSGEW